MFADIPYPIASSLTVPAAVVRLVAELDEFKGAWRALGVLKPERLSELRYVATIESIGSSTRIEGSRMTDREVEELLGRIEVRQFVTRDAQEVAGYSDVMELVFSQWADIPLTESSIRQLHRELLRYSDKDDWHRGAYKTLPNQVEAFDADGASLGVVFHTAPPHATPENMRQLVAWTAAALEERQLHPLLITGVFVVTFLEIHPFQDGNGRLSRILTTLLLLKAGYAYVPYSSLESVIERSKQAYYLNLRRTQSTLRSPTPDWLPWLRFFLESLAQQKRALERKLELEHTLQQNLTELAIEILEIALKHGRITLQTALAGTDGKLGTVKATLRRLVDEGHLQQHGVGRGTWYTRV